jgi:hypothetical protein
VAQSWFIMRGESRLGPFTHHGLITLASTGGLSQDDFVWCADLPAPMPAIGVAGLFPEPEPEPEAPTPPPSPYRPPPRPRAVAPSEVEVAFSAPRKDRFAALFEDGGDASVAEEDEDSQDEVDPTVPLVRRPARRAVPARRKADHSGLLIGLGGLSLLAVIVLIIVLEQGETRPSRPAPGPKPPAPVVRQPQSPAPPPIARPERPQPPAPPPPRFDKQPLIDEMTKGTVDAIYQANPSVKARYRELWESQLQTLLTQETKGMREEQQVRAAVTRVCDAWLAETTRFVATESAPAPAPEPDAIDNAAQPDGGGDAPMELDGEGGGEAE